MRRNDTYTRIIMAALFIAVIGYIGARVYMAVDDVYVSELAVSYTVDEAAKAAGYAVREESAFYAGEGSFAPVAAEGEKVSAGQEVAALFNSAAAMEKAGEALELKRKIKRLEASGEGSGGQGARASVMELSRVVRLGNLENLESAALNVESSVFTGGEASSDDIAALRERLNALEVANTGARPVTAPESGVFSERLDGYEGITPDMLSGLTPTGLETLFASHRAAGGNYKLVTGIRWYYAALMSEGDAARLTVGKTVKVQFEGEYRGTLQMKVESIGRGEDGRRAVVFSCGEGIKDTAGLRYIEAEVIFQTYSGVLVPKEAVRLDEDGVTYVMLRVGVRSERADIMILRELGGGYLVNNIEGNALHEGSEIIVFASGLEDGKVVT